MRTLVILLGLVGVLTACGTIGGVGGVEHPWALWWILGLSLSGLFVALASFFFGLAFRGHERRADRREDRRDRRE